MNPTANNSRSQAIPVHPFFHLVKLLDSHQKEIALNRLHLLHGPDFQASYDVPKDKNYAELCAQAKSIELESGERFALVRIRPCEICHQQHLVLHFTAEDFRAIGLDRSAVPPKQ